MNLIAAIITLPAGFPSSAGALGAFVLMFQSETDLSCLSNCCEALRCLALDPSSRRQLMGLGVLDLLLTKLQRHGMTAAADDGGGSSDDDAAVVCCTAADSAKFTSTALEALAVLVRDDPARRQLWASPQKHVLLDLLDPQPGSSSNSGSSGAANGTSASSCSAGTACGRRSASLSRSISGCSARSGGCRSSEALAVLLDALKAVTHLAFSVAEPRILLEPLLVPQLAQLLHPSQDAPVVAGVLQLLVACASCSHSSCVTVDPLASADVTEPPSECPSPRLAPSRTSGYPSSPSNQCSEGLLSPEAFDAEKRRRLLRHPTRMAREVSLPARGCFEDPQSPFYQDPHSGSGSCFLAARADEPPADSCTHVLLARQGTFGRSSSFQRLASQNHVPSLIADLGRPERGSLERECSC